MPALARFGFGFLEVGSVTQRLVHLLPAFGGLVFLLLWLGLSYSYLCGTEAGVRRLFGRACDPLPR